MFSRAWFCIFAATVLYIDAASAEPMQVDSRLARRNLGGPLKDWYLMKMTKNYFCTDTGRVIPVDPETGHMLLKGLRRRSSIDDFFHTSHATEHGICKNASWVLPYNWNQPIPRAQFEAQYPWMYVDDAGQMRFKPDYLEWLKQQGALRASQPATAAGAQPAPANSIASAPLGNGIMAGTPAAAV